MNYPKIKRKVEMLDGGECFTADNSTHMSICSDLSMAYQYNPEAVERYNQKMDLRVDADDAKLVASSVGEKVISFLQTK